MQWEYRMVTTMARDDLMEHLTALGMDQRELVAVTVGSQFYAFLKRPLPN